MSPLRLHNRPSFRRAAASVLGVAALALVAASPVAAEGPAAGGGIAIHARLCDAPPVHPLDCGPAEIGALTLVPADGATDILPMDEATITPDTLSWGDQQPVPYDRYLIDTTYLNVPAGYMLSDVVPGNNTDAGYSESGWYVNLTPEQPWANVYVVLTPASDSQDADGDGLSNEDEIAIHGTNPNAADSDFDGAPDDHEVSFGSNPLDAQDWPAVQAGPDEGDSDGDGVSDADETTIYGTDPNNADSDSDGAPDYAEIWAGTNPLDGQDWPAVQAGPDNGPSAGPSDADDSDGDGAGDLTETVAGTDPYDPSSFPAAQAGPSDADDSDGDGFGDKTETVAGTDPYDASSVPGDQSDNGDADADQVSDVDEVTIYATDPNNPDTDGDGAPDYAEIWAGSDPLNDQDWPAVQAGPEPNDAINDAEEFTVAGTDANKFAPSDQPAETAFAAASSDGTGGTAGAEEVSGSADLAPAHDGTSTTPVVLKLPSTGSGTGGASGSAIDANVLIALATGGTFFAGLVSMRRRTR